MSRCTRFLSLATLLVGSLASAADDPEQNYLLLPVTTALQRTLLSPATAAYGVVNANALILDGKIDPSALSLPAFRAELAALAANNPGTITIYCRFQNWQPQPAAEELLEAALTQLCRKAGFERVATGKIYTGDPWQREIESLASTRPAHTEHDEAAVEDENARAFPVKTKLSRFLTGNADVVVCVRRPIDGRMEEFPEGTLLSIRNCVVDLHLESTRVLNLRVTSTKAGEAIIEEFINNNGAKFSPANRFAKSIGFESSTVSHSPGGGAPETLLGKPPPDFSLDTLDGQTLHFHDHIRGKVALVTFWGVACGPCRQEAPHLSALFKKYQDAGFTLLAVNAYDESQEAVAEYVRKESLTHPIVLLGRDVAREKFSVGAYPTGFWINRQGRVVDYVVGFDPGNESQIAATLERLLTTPTPPSP